MDNPHSSFNVVIFTEYTSVYPTYSVVVVTDYTTVHATNVPTPSEAPTTSLVSTITGSQTMSAGSSASALPPISSTPPETTGGQKFDDTFAYVILILIMLVAILLLTMIISMVYLRWRGKCPECQTMRKQLDKWESGEQKPVTPAVVRQREAFNKAASQITAPGELDLERGSAGGADKSFSAVLSNLRAEKRPSIWRMIKRKPVPNTGASAAVTKDAVYSHFNRSFRVQSNPPQVHYEPSAVYTPSAYRSSVGWPEFQYAEMQHNDGRGSRVFTDVSVFPTKHYAAYVTDEDDLGYPDIREQEIRNAQAAIESEEYRIAETIMKRASAPDSVIRRATSIVNLADQRLNIARNPSMYPEFCRPESECGEHQPEGHQGECHKRGSKAPKPEDELYLDC